MNSNTLEIELLTFDNDSPTLIPLDDDIEIIDVFNPYKNIIKDEDIEILSFAESNDESKVIYPTDKFFLNSSIKQTLNQENNIITSEKIENIPKTEEIINKNLQSEEKKQEISVADVAPCIVEKTKVKGLSKIKKIQTKIILSILILLNAGILVVMGHRVYTWYQNNQQIDREVAEINKLAIDKNNTNTEEIEILEDPNETTTTTKTPDEYFEMRKTSIGDVNFEALKKINKDTKGWIKVGGTEVNYPFVQSTDNDYYLKHSFSGTQNYAGWIFLDFRNDINNLSKNTVIYGHGRLNNTMFGSLKKTVKDNWLSNTNNFYIETATETGHQKWQIFSTYTILPESYYITTRFSDSQFQTFIDTIKSRSVHNFNVDVTKNDHILTLSSCYDNSKRVVVHAKLVSAN